MKSPIQKAIAILCTFFVLVFSIAFAFNRHYPMLVITGENSVGTWMSGTLLIISATLSLIIGMRQGSHPWFLSTVFFLLLALDERFMFHEQMKEQIIFSFRAKASFIYELPVIAGAFAGALLSFFLWRYMPNKSRILLLSAAVLGTASVIIDILTVGVFWEECFKLFAELLLVCALVMNIRE